MNSSVYAIILAAGTSSRMGTTKQTLPLGNKPLLEHVIQLVFTEEFIEVFAVIGHEATAIQSEITVPYEHFRWIENEAYRLGQSSSLKLAADNLPREPSNVMVFLGDLPFLSPETIRLIYQSGAKRTKKSEEMFLIRPIYKGVAGHPVFFGNLDKNLFAELEGDTGAKAIIKQISNHILLEVSDSGILFDVDTPKDYEEAKKIYASRFE